MAQNEDPFSLQFGPMIPAGSVTSQPDEVAPALPPRPKRRPVNAATCQPPGDPSPPPLVTQSSQFGGRGINPPNPLPSFATPNFNGAAPGYGAISPAFSAQVAARPLEGQLNQVVVNGVKLGQADLLALQAVVGPILPGSYWYDRVSGAYGMAGGPCNGFLSANLPLGGGPLASDASGCTGTRVFINGREIHTIDIMGLQRMGAVVMQGRWWLNADGSYGPEGSFVVLGRLRLQANAANNAGGAHSWSTGMGHYGGSDGQGFSYVGGPGWSWSSG
ncbi:hypothetical protein BFJ69_g8782 [Fusarium oxysporum]|uniref:Extra-large guanine nucleotide-binding protein 1 n=1 Tax=Fusarium oxysporum TaxID=5507 RepID=A0A420N1D4_FUSOX|nr:hypothetical protein BFJ69_g8782 [Fusarium oxysporum]